MSTKALDTKTLDPRTSYVFVRAGAAAAILMFALAAPAGAQQQRLTSPATPYSSAAMRVQTTKADKGIYHGETTPKGAFPFVVALIQSEANNDEEGNYNG